MTGCKFGVRLRTDRDGIGCCPVEEVHTILTASLALMLEFRIFQPVRGEGRFCPLLWRNCQGAGVAGTSTNATCPGLAGKGPEMIVAEETREILTLAPTLAETIGAEETHRKLTLGCLTWLGA